MHQTQLINQQLKDHEVEYTKTLMSTTLAGCCIRKKLASATIEGWRRSLQLGKSSHTKAKICSSPSRYFNFCWLFFYFQFFVKKMSNTVVRKKSSWINLAEAGGLQSRSKRLIPMAYILSNCISPHQKKKMEGQIENWRIYYLASEQLWNWSKNAAVHLTLISEIESPQNKLLEVEIKQIWWRFEWEFLKLPSKSLFVFELLKNSSTRNFPEILPRSQHQMTPA